MAKATITLSSGTKIVVEGDPDEIKDVVNRLEKSPSAKGQDTPKTKKITSKKKVEGSIKGYIQELRDADYFKKPKLVVEVKKALEIEGHFLVIPAVSTTLIRLVKSREMRRLKDNGKWKYVER